MQIRAYENRDETAVVALWNAVLYDPAPHNEPRRSLHRKLQVDRDLLLVAEDGNRLLGTVMGGYDGHRGWIYSVAVDPACRRQGIGTALLRRIEAILRERGCLKINLQVRANNVGVIPFYESLGFRVDDLVSLGKRLYSEADDIS